MRILLIDPPFYRIIGYYNRYFPLGLTYLAATLRNEGHEVLIYDGDCNIKATDIDYTKIDQKYQSYLDALNNNNYPEWKRIKEALDSFQPHLVGITALTTKFGSALKVAEICKEYRRDCLVAMGGSHPTIRPEEALASRDVNFVIRGEGEETLIKLIKAVEGKGEKIEEIEGISYRSIRGIMHNHPAGLLDNLDLIPFPARDLLMGIDYYTSEDMGLMMTSRGCPFNCTFCSSKSIWGRRTRFRSIENIIEEIKMVKEKYGTVYFTFKDDVFTVNKKRVIEFCQRLLEEKIKFVWECDSRAGTLDEEMMSVMKKSGCVGIKIGVESGSSRILKLIKKGEEKEDFRKFSNLSRKYGTFWTAYFIMGLPTETKEEIEETYNFMKELNPGYASIGAYEPFPETEMFNLGIELGEVKKNMSLEEFWKEMPHNYYVVNKDKRLSVIPGDEFEEIKNKMIYLFGKHNRRLINILRRVISRKKMYYRDFKMLFSDIGKFFSWLKLKKIQE